MPVISYGAGLRHAANWLLKECPDVTIMGQGVWSPWYVGETMTDLAEVYGRSRVIDTPVSEAATSGAGIGLALMGKRALVVHPRVDFALLATDAIINQAAKWSSMFGGETALPVTFRLIVNRGGAQGAQHSQALHSLYAHIPGLRVVVPSRPTDAFDLLRASVLSKDPVVFMDDRWLYETTEHVDLTEAPPTLESVVPVNLIPGTDATFVSCGYSLELCIQAAKELRKVHGIEVDLWDLRQLSPLDLSSIIASVRLTGRLLVVDGDWGPCGIASEVVCGVAEALPIDGWSAQPRRINPPFVPAPTSISLEPLYYPTVPRIVGECREMVGA